MTHLAGLGHRRIGLVAGRPGLGATRERITGYRHGLATAGLPWDERLVVHGDSEAAGGERATGALLSLSVPPTALVTANNAMTIGALRAARAPAVDARGPRAVLLRRLRLGGPLPPRAHRRGAARQEIGARAVRLLLDYLAEPDRPGRTEQLALCLRPPHLVRRPAPSGPGGPASSKAIRVSLRNGSRRSAPRDRRRR